MKRWLAMLNRVRLKEYESSNNIKLSDSDLAALERNKKFVTCLGTSSKENYKIKAEQWVGELRMPGVHVSISPKIGNADFLRMLLEGDGEAIPKDVLSGVKNNDNFVDLLARNFLNELDLLFKSGLERKYIEQEENSLFCKGQVQVFQDILNNVPVRNGVYCRFDELSTDTQFNQILNLSLQLLLLSVSNKWIDKLARASGMFSDVSKLNTFPIFDLPIKSHKYRRVLYYTKLIQRSLSQTPSSFGVSGYGFMLDMNKVFEGFIRNRLRSEIEKRKMGLLSKEKVDFCKYMKINPDLRITSGNRVVLVGDVKYKEDWHYSGYNSDVYQMLAYFEHYRNSSEAIIFYPSSSETLFTESIELPNRKSVRKIGIPRSKTFDEKIWKEITDIVVSHAV